MMSMASQRRIARPREAGSRIPLAATLLLTALGVGCGGSSAKSNAAQGPPAIPVKIEVARAVPVSDVTEYVAMLKSRDSAVIMPQVEGYITQIHVHSGDHVSAGTPLMQIDPSKQEATVRSQEDTHAAKQADVEYASQQYERTSGLYKAGVVSKQDLDQG